MCTKRYFLYYLAPHITRILNMKSKLFLIVLTAFLYWVIQNYVPYGAYALMPINLFVTFLHELGHALFALITGGSVHEVYIQSDGSGHAVTAGGFIPLILMGGYIGSALLGNLLLFIGLCKPKSSIITLYLLIALLVFTAIWWYSHWFTSALLIVIAALAFWISKKSKNLVANLLIIIGTASIIYIIMDYNAGPSSDLARFTEIIPIFPKAVWAIIWLIAVMLITWKNMHYSYKKNKLL